MVKSVILYLITLVFSFFTGSLFRRRREKINKLKNEIKTLKEIKEIEKDVDEMSDSDIVNKLIK